MAKSMQSKRFTLNKEDGKKILIGAGVAVAGALLTYVSETLTKVDFGTWTPLVTALWAVVANALRKYLMGK